MVGYTARYFQSISATGGIVTKRKKKKREKKRKKRKVKLTSREGNLD